MATWRQTLSSNQYYEVILNVNQTSQSIANNTSNISWSLQVRKSYGSGFWGADGTASTWTVKIDGTTVSNSSSSYDFRGGAPLTKTIASGTRTITHAGDGSKSIAVSGYWKDNVNGLGNATASGTFTLTTIPRATTISAFSFASHLKNGVANTINYTVSRKSGNFRHQIQLRDGSTTVLQWDNISSDGSSTQALTAAEVNKLLTRMPTSTTKSFTLRIATRSGVNGGFIGSAVSRNATGTVHADVKPVLSNMTFGISGSGVDKTINKYVQGHTKVTAKVTRTAGYGSNIRATTMTVQRTNGSNAQIIRGIDGTTANPVAYSGTYQVVYKTTDERGRSVSATSSSFTVHAYSPPSITSFTLSRNTTTPTQVSVVASGTFSSIGGSNKATLNIQRRSGTSWANVGTDNTSTNGTISRTQPSTGNLITSSYEFKARITDLFGGVAEAIDTVSTQQVVMDVYRNQGVAFGKLYEPSLGGALQVGGELNGGLFLGGQASESPLRVRGIEGHGGGNDINMATNDLLYLNWNGKNAVYTGGNLNVDGAWTKGYGVVERGTNTNGEYMQFENGLMISFGEVARNFAITIAGGGIYRGDLISQTFPSTYATPPAISVTPDGGGPIWFAPNSVNGIAFNGYFQSYSTRNLAGKRFMWMAVGRWKR